MRKFAVVFSIAAASAFAASDDAAIQSTFVKPWVEALRLKDQARMERFLHPAVRACINPGNKDFFDFAFEQEAYANISGPYRITKIEPMRQAAPTFLPTEDVQYPVQPTYEVNIEFEQNNYVFVRFLAPLLVELKDPLRSELRALLGRDLKYDAIKKYQAATNADLTSAVAVINALQESKQ